MSSKTVWFMVQFNSDISLFLFGVNDLSVDERWSWKLLLCWVNLGFTSSSICFRNLEALVFDL